jgi:polar amino acid transport system permease protein
LTNQIIGLIKESALLSILGVVELSLVADSITGRTFVATKTYLILAGIYWVLTALVAQLMMQLERRFVVLRPSARVHNLTAVPSEG